VALGAILCLPVWTLFMLIGTLVWSYYQLSGEALPPHVNKADEVFPYFLATKIPAGLAGIFMAALFAAGMSTLSSDLNCLCAIAVQDYYRKLRPAASDRACLGIGKVVVALCGFAMVGIAALIAWKSERVLSLYYAVSSIISGGLAGLFLLVFFSRRANQSGVWCGIVAGLLFTPWATLTRGKNKMLDLGDHNYTLPGVMIGVLAHLVVLVVGYLASWLFPRHDRGQDVWTFWAWLEKRKQVSTLP